MKVPLNFKPGNARLVPQPLGTVCIIGHEPDLSSLVSWLIGTSAYAVVMKKASIAVLDVDPPSSHATLEMLLPAKEGLSD